MKAFKTSLVFAFILFLTTNPAFAQGNNSVSQILSDSYTTAIKKGDIKGIITLYTQDATIRNSDGSITKGIKNIEAQYQSVFDAGQYKIELKAIEDAPLDKNYYFSSGTYTFTGLDKDKTVTAGTYVNVLKKVKKDWKIYKSYRFTSDE